MNKEEVLKLLEQIEEKYVKMLEKERQGESHLKEGERLKIDAKTHPEIYREIQKEIFSINIDSDLMNDLDILVKLEPYSMYKIEGMSEIYEELDVDDGEEPELQTLCHIIYCTRGEEKIEISLYENEYGDWGEYTEAGMDVDKVEEFGEMTHKAKEPMYFELYDADEFACEAFGYSRYGGDDIYHPYGSYFVNFDKFIEIQKENQDLKEVLNSETRLEALKEEKNELEIKNKEAQKLINQFETQLGVDLGEEEQDTK